MVDYSDSKAVKKKFLRAIENQEFEEIEKLFPLVSKGLKWRYITSDNFSPLHYAASPKMVRFFISTGVDINVKNLETDETPLLTSIKLKKPPKFIKKLLKHGASTDARNRHTMNTPLIQAAQVSKCPPETIQVLLEYGATVYEANKYGDTPLHNACRCYRSDLRIVELLLKAGSPVNFRNSLGDTPLNLSLKNRLCTAELVRMLLKFNAKVKVKAILDAVNYLESCDDFLNILSELVMQASITRSDHWAKILQLMFWKVKDIQKLEESGKLIIKYAFLHCEKRHVLVDCCSNALKKYLLNSYSLFLSIFPIMTVQGLQVDRKFYLHTLVRSFNSFAVECLSEIKRMEKDKIRNKTSVYQIIASKTRKFPLHVNIIKILRHKSYPIYSDVILRETKRAALVDKLIVQKVYTIVPNGGSRKIVLDAHSVDNIVKYLNIEEIRNLVDAFYDPLRDEYCFWDKLAKIEAQLSKYHQASYSETEFLESMPAHISLQAQILFGL